MRRIGVLVAILTLVLGVASSSTAIVYGEPDGQGHPNVGALIAEWVEPGVKSIACSGTLIGPDVFLTAGHCTDTLASLGIDDVWVTFDAVTDIPLDESVTTLIPGSYVTHPEYGYEGPGGQSDPHDIAVVLLDQAASAAYPGIQPASLPTLGRFADHRALRGQRFTAVGYGAREPVLGGGPPTFPYDGRRWRAVSSFRAVENVWLRLSQNRSTGDGGSCFGDSGGPNFLGAFGVDETSIVAAITIQGDSMCRATSVTYRLDTASARSFLSGFVPVP